MRYLTFLTLIILIACKAKETNNNISLHTYDIPSDFMDFYQRFHYDSTYQMDHIIFPLSKKTDSTLWLKENWKLHRPFDNSSNEFIREFSNLNDIIFEIIVSKDKSFQMERRFSKSGNTYNLIYYNVHYAFENSGFEQIIE